MDQRMRNGEPPPSTFAAQIVDNLESTKNQPFRASSTAHLRELLRRVLDADRAGGSADGTFEEGLEVNHKLICVVVRACLLSPTTNADPFEKQKDVHDQAYDCLAVIEVTIRRCPDVLFALVRCTESYFGPEGPLFLWLIPHLLNLLGDPRGDDELRAGIKKVIRTALFANGRTTSFLPVLRFIQGCLDDLVCFVEAKMGIGQDSLFDYQVPSLRTLKDVLPSSASYFGAPACVLHENLPKDFFIVAHTLAIVALPDKEDQGGKPRQTSRAFHEWILNCLARLWSVVIPRMHLRFEHLWHTSYRASMQVLRVCIGRKPAYPHQTAIGDRAVRTLCYVVALVLQDSLNGADHRLDDKLQKEICWSVVQLLAQGSKCARGQQIYDEELQPVVDAVLSSQDVLECYSKDLQRTLLLAPYIAEKEHIAPSHDWLAFEDQAINLEFQKLVNVFNTKQPGANLAPPQKRTRFSENADGKICRDAEGQLHDVVCSILDVPPHQSEEGVFSLVFDAFGDLPQEKQCRLLAAFGEAACSNSIPKTEASCLACECDAPKQASMTLASEDFRQQIYNSMMQMARICQTEKVSQPRVAAMISFRRLLAHTTLQTHLDIKTSPLSAWCLQSMKSSLRELRIAAVSALGYLVRDGLDRKVLQSNRRTSLDFLRTMAESGDISLQETCILALGRIISSISSEDEINIALLRLIEYLGHPNLLLCNLAFEELQKLSSHSHSAAMRLFEPYWRTVAIAVVRDLHKRPQIAQLISDLLGIGVSEFLKLTQFHTMPYLIVAKKLDVLERIAEAKGQGNDVGSLFLDRHPSAAILAYLLLQPSQDPESTTMALLRNVTSMFETVELAEIVKSYPLEIAYELLKAAGEQDEELQARAQRAIYLLAEKTTRRASSNRVSNKKHGKLKVFFDDGAMGVLHLLSDVISQTKARQPLSERVRCLGAIREMATMAKSNISDILPQISSCLRSAMEEPALCNVAFDTWMTLMSTLQKDDIESLVDPTFAIIAQHWDTFEPEVQQRAHDMISNLLKSYSDMIREMVNTIPSLGDIPLLSKFESELGKLKAQWDPRHRFQAYVKRCQSENVTVVARAIIELGPYLENHQSFLQTSAVSAKPDPVIGQLVRSLLNACLRFSEDEPAIAVNCAKCLGLIGCLDPTRVEAAEENKEIFMLSNFADVNETIEFLIVFMQEVLVKTFLSTTDSLSQNLLAYVMQELLRSCGFTPANTIRRDLQPDMLYRKWINIPESTRSTLVPFLTSKFVLEALPPLVECKYPIYSVQVGHSTWLRFFVLDLLGKAQGDNASTVFSLCKRIIRRQDIAIPNFLLPFAALNVILEGPTEQKNEIAQELLHILSLSLPDNQAERENLIMCSNNVFRIIDHFSRWIQEKKRQMSASRAAAHRTGRAVAEATVANDLMKIENVDTVLRKIPAQTMSQRAIECKSYARALFYWEQYIRQRESQSGELDISHEDLYAKLQDIYTQIEEPDGIEGISARLHVLNIDQQVIEHRQAGRWTAIQSWHELQLDERPQDLEVQFNLLTSLKESAQYGKLKSLVLALSLIPPSYKDGLLNQISELSLSKQSLAVARPFAVEACWVTGKWEKLDAFLKDVPIEDVGDFNVGIGSALLALHKQDYDEFSKRVQRLWKSAARSLSSTTASSLQSCHDTMLRFHVLTEVERISGVDPSKFIPRPDLMNFLGLRIDSLGAYSSDKQYLLGLRRATMEASKSLFYDLELSSAWLASARLARKSQFMHQAYHAVLHAHKLGDDSATIELARLLWKEGHHRKAIQSLEGAIRADAFQSSGDTISELPVGRRQQDAQRRQNPVAARAHLLLAKWIDHAGQTQSDFIIKQYQTAVDFHNRSDKGHYYLGKHYNKLLESEKAKEPAKQAQTFINGEMAKLVIDNYLRSLAMGAKYIHQTLPRILTLWLELGSDVEHPVDPKYGNDVTFRNHVESQRKKMFGAVMSSMRKYIDRLPPFVFYTAFAQIVARICHKNETVYASLVEIVAKVVTNHPQQALWTLLAMMKSTTTAQRAQRGVFCSAKVLENAKRLGSDTARAEIKNMMNQGQKLSDQLLKVCEGEIGYGKNVISLRNDLGFNHAICAPCRLVIPLESTLLANLPTVTDNMKTHKPFSKDTVTITVFLDDAQILQSLIKPKRISIRGSDGRVYGMLCKPKDDLRKDQRLLEFNSMISRILKKDSECSKRRLYIKTYAVTPLNENCGLIEWVDGLRTIRDILLELYKRKGVSPDYSSLRDQLNVISNDASKAWKFEKEVLTIFKPVLHEWFVQLFPEPETWFNARLRYTRSCAVMSMVGHVLGLGDRHGENILFEEGQGGVVHVDFNCLFDKGKTFEKPELVPFRLTHNMVDAFGAYGCDGPFRRSCELTLGILRQHEHTLMTILETFLYDPTTDFVGKKKRAKSMVPETPEGVLESVRNKVRGLLPGESVPLSVEGYVQVQIQQATDPFNLARMYIGWCAFL